MNSETIFVW